MLCLNQLTGSSLYARDHVGVEAPGIFAAGTARCLEHLILVEQGCCAPAHIHQGPQR